MCSYSVTKEEIEKAEKDIFENGEHFNDEQKTFLKCLDSCCVQAYAGTGKTSTIVGKLHILSQKNVWQNGRGICVISHTNVAVDEIKKHVAKHYPTIMQYPNFIGTIQEFINKFLFTPYLASHKLQIRFQNESRFVDYGNELQNQTIEGRIKNKISQLNFSKNIEATSDFFERLKTIHLVDNKLYARKKNGGFNEYLDLKTQTVPQNIIENGFRYLITKKHETGNFLFIESFVYGYEYIKNNPILKKIINQRFQFVFLDEAQDCSEIQLRILKELFSDNSKTVFQQIGDENQAITESVWKTDSSNTLCLGKTERFDQKLANFVNIFKIDGGSGLKGKKIATESDNIKLYLLIYVAGQEKDILKKFTEIIKNEHIPNDKDFFVISHEHKQLNRYFYDYYDEKTAKNKNKKIYYRFDDDSEYIKLLSKKDLHERGSNSIAIILFSLLYKHFKASGGSWNELKEYLRTSGKIDIFRKIVLEISNDLLQNDRISKSEDLKRHLNEILGLDLINFNNIIPSLAISAENRVKSNKFIHNDVEINIGTIHSVKGQTHNATLFFSNKEWDKYDICHALLSNANPRTLDFKRLLYVSSSRPKYLFTFAIEKSVANLPMIRSCFSCFKHETI